MTLEYRYQALDTSGSAVRGSIEADNERAAARQLRRMDLRPIELMRAAAGIGDDGVQAARLALRPPSAQDKALMVREFSTMLISGMQLAETVHTLAQAHASELLGQAFLVVHRRLRAGEVLSSALEGSGIEWPLYLIQLVKAGEQTGRLGEALLSAAEQMEYDERVRQEIRSALIYPIVLVVTGVAATLLIFIVVVPKFAGILKNSRAEVPALSVWVLQAGLFVKDNLLAVMLSLAALAGTLIYLLRQSKFRQHLLESASRLPVVGRWLRETDVGRWAMMMATLLDNRVAILKAMEMAQESVLLATWRSHLQQATRAVKSGKRITDGLAGSDMVGSTAINLIRVGEQSGQLAKMMRTLANLYEDQGRERLKRLLTLLEPVAILCIGGVVGILMVAIMLAITSLSNISL